MMAQGRVRFNLRYDSESTLWHFTVGSATEDSILTYEFKMSHPELADLNDNISRLLDSVEQQAGSVLRRGFAD